MHIYAAFLLKLCAYGIRRLFIGMNQNRRGYEEALEKDNAIDSDSLILKTYELFSHNPSIANYYKNLYQAFIFDEFQNITDTFYAVLRQISHGPSADIVVALDEAQQIYKWAMSMIKPAMRFEEDYRSSLILFNDNFRCPPNILYMAEQLVERTEQSMSSVSKEQGTVRVRPCSLSEEETDWIAEDIKKLLAEDPSSSVAVLARYRDQLDPIIDKLSKRGIPAKVYSSDRLFQSEPIRWLYSFLQFSRRSTDERWFGKLVEHTQEVFGSKLELNLTMLYSLESTQRWDGYIEAMDDFFPPGLQIARKAADSVDLQQLTKWALAVIFWFAEGNFDPRFSHEADYFKRKLHQGQDRSLAEFLSLLDDESSGLHEEKLVVCQTIHSSLGKEYDHVYVPGFREGNLPELPEPFAGSPSFNLEDERRLCYVAFTRTKRSLTLTYATADDLGTLYKPSRFIQELGLPV
jgi:DNA helicase-2/ATP-dependent DNA helicase PcrA